MLHEKAKYYNFPAYFRGEIMNNSNKGEKLVSKTTDLEYSTKQVNKMLYYIRNQQDATLAVLFISHCKITLHVTDAFCFHHQEY